MTRFVTALVAIVAAFGLATAGAQDKKRISISTGGTGGVYYPLGGGLAAVLTKYVPGLDATAEVTAGSIANLQLIDAGKSEVAFTMGRRRVGRVQRPRQVQRQESGPALDRGVLSQPHAGGHDRRQGHRQVRRPQGQARPTGAPVSGTEGDGDAPHRGLRPRPQQGHDARAPLGPPRA